MAKAPTEEQSQLKRRARRRLVGSIALVTVVAVVLPWVLEREPRPSEQQIAIQIPPPNSDKFDPKQPARAPAASVGIAGEGKSEQTTAAPADEKTAAPSSSAAPADDALRAEQAKVLAPPVKLAPTQKAAPSKDTKAHDKSAAEPKKKPTEKSEAAVAEAKKKPAEKPVEKSDAVADSKSGADAKPYVVQVAALADTDKAADIQKALAAKGLKVYTEKVKTANGEVTRVRVGPFPNRDAAEKERGRMKSLGFDGNVAPK